MTTIRELLASGAKSFSFEFFPPRTDEGEALLWRAIRELEPLAPTFVSVTCRSGEPTHDRTVRVVKRIAAETSITPVAHLTCSGVSQDTLRRTATDLLAAGVNNVLALRGDPTGGLDKAWEAHEQGLEHADELVRLLHEEGEFCIGVAAFPELHPESPDRQTDVRFFVDKVRAGADFAVTQFFFRAEDYFELVDAVRAAGCDAPIIPGIMPVTNVSSIERMAALSGAAFPAELAERLRAVAEDPEAVRAIGVEFAGELCRELLDGGAPGIHFYTLNRSTATREIYQRLGLPVS
ncbi:MAG TPA: methylenetetrahydrofolate reductase [NAD(P)H] [Egibacteraceae bacterium]|nr:methylenetetrahydrofolate reductase [NAD(P)H] [Egibacteraceae bacterium]